MQVFALLFHWGNYHWARNLLVLIIYFSSLLCCPLYFQGSPQTRQRECFLVFGNFSLFKTSFLGQDSLPRTELPPYFFCLFFHLLYFSYLFLKTMIHFSGCLMSSASIQKLFCRIYSALKCSFDEFVGEKVVSPSYSSAILGLPLRRLYTWTSPDGQHQNQIDYSLCSQRMKALHSLQKQDWEGDGGKDGGGIGQEEHFLHHKFLKRTFQR